MTQFVDVGGDPNFGPTSWSFTTAGPVVRAWTIDHAANGANGVPASTTIRADLVVTDQIISATRFYLGVWMGPVGGPFVVEVVRLFGSGVFEAGWTGDIVLVDDHHATVTVDRVTDFAAGVLVDPAFRYFVL